MRAKITINDPEAGVSIAGLCLGDFFRFPTSAEGSAYVVTEFVLDGRKALRSVRYRKLDNGACFETGTDYKKVNRLHLVSAAFDLERN